RWPSYATMLHGAHPLLTFLVFPTTVSASPTGPHSPTLEISLSLRTPQRRQHFKEKRRLCAPFHSICCYFDFSKSLISVSNTSSFDGSGGAACASSPLRFKEFIPLISRKIQNAMIRNSIITLVKLPYITATSAISLA